MTGRWVGIGVVSAAVVLIGADGPAEGRRADQEALKPFGGLVGGWRGTGQVERGRTKGAWAESADWAWTLTADSAGLAVEVSRGKHLKSGVLRPGRAPGTFAFDAVLADGSPRRFVGKAAPGGRPKLVLEAEGAPGKDAAATVRRLTITPLHDTRLVLLLEGQNPDRENYFRLGEVGYTREGVAFAAGDSSPVCIVTEGRGTTPVSYKGKTYYVCCSGCRDLFNDDPEGVLAEAEARRKEKEKAGRK